MKIVVDNKLTYNTKDFAVAVGDKVLLPPTPWMSENWIGTVTHLKSDHSGPIKDIVGIVTSVPGATARKQRQESAKILLNEKIAPNLKKNYAAAQKSKLLAAITAEQEKVAAKFVAKKIPLLSWKEVLFLHDNSNIAHLDVMVAHAKFLGYKYVTWNGNVLRVADIQKGYSLASAFECKMEDVS